MGVGYNPRMITNGLVLCLDAGNARSYPGSGTTWTDLSGNGNNGSMSNVTYNAGNGGYMSFNGTTSIVDCGTSNTLDLTSFTLEVIIYPIDAGENNLSRIIDRSSVGTVGYMYWLNNTLTADGINSITLSTFTPETKLSLNNAITVNTWHHHVTTLSGTTANLYLNGSSIATNASMTVPTSGTANFYIGNRAATDRTFNGRIAVVKVYNRALLAAEIRQNFNATRGRYGI